MSEPAAKAPVVTSPVNPPVDPPQKKKSDLGARVLTAVLALPFLFYFIFAAPSWAFAALIMMAAAVSTWEFLDITLNEYCGSFGWLRYFGGGLSALLFWTIYYFYNSPGWYIPVLCLVAILPLAALLLQHKDQRDVSFLYGTVVAGILYGTLPISCLALYMYVAHAGHAGWILLTLGITWGSDTAAYFGGRAFGKHKLSPKVSPNKTVEGAVSGLLGSILFAFLINAFFSWIASTPLHTELFGFSALTVDLFWHPLSFVQILLLAIPANIASQLGDLAESLIKRGHGVKDSGVIIYGHGGILDRIDGVIFSAPWVFFSVLVFFDKV